MRDMSHVSHFFRFLDQRRKQRWKRVGFDLVSIRGEVPGQLQFLSEAQSFCRRKSTGDLFLGVERRSGGDAQGTGEDVVGGYFPCLAKGNVKWSWRATTFGVTERDVF